jgi:hypothetical protein
MCMTFYSRKMGGGFKFKFCYSVIMRDAPCMVRVYVTWYLGSELSPYFKNHTRILHGTYTAQQRNLDPECDLDIHQYTIVILYYYMSIPNHTFTSVQYYRHSLLLYAHSKPHYTFSAPREMHTWKFFLIKLIFLFLDFHIISSDRESSF